MRDGGSILAVILQVLRKPVVFDVIDAYRPSADLSVKKKKHAIAGGAS
jgi:hypothetical protein